MSYQCNTEKYKRTLAVRRPDLICIGEYSNCVMSVRHKCLTCEHEWRESPTSILYGKLLCPNCKYMKRHNLFLNRLANEQPNVKCIGGYVDNLTHTDFRCSACDKVWLGRPDGVLSRGHKCKKRTK